MTNAAFDVAIVPDFTRWASVSGSELLNFLDTRAAPALAMSALAQPVL